MKADDQVTYLAHPEWGAGVIREVSATGLLLVAFEIAGEHGYYEDLFDAHEVEMAERVETPA